MNPWGTYTARMDASGSTMRESVFLRESRYINSKAPNNLYYFTVDIDGRERDIAVISTDNLNEKIIYSMSGDEVILPGSLVYWMDNNWIVTESDANTELHTRARMIQCNYLLKWIDSDHVIHEQWCIVEDGTKYLTGQYEDREFFVTRGDSRLGLTIAKNEHTTKMRRGDRFLIDDADSELMLAYEMTKPFKLSGVYNGHGVFKFVLQEVNTTDDDNQDLCIADYYKHFPRDNGEITPENTIDPDNNITPDGKKVWL